MKTNGDSWATEALRDAAPKVFWSDRSDGPAAAASLTGVHAADLTVVGGGFTGLWTAIQALEENPGRSVCVIEAERCGFGASSRNGGFCDSSLTHGLENGLAHWADDIHTLLRLGRQNLDAIERFVADHNVDADFRRASEVSVATEQWHIDSIEEGLNVHIEAGYNAELLDASAMQERVHSPTYLGGLALHNDVALVDPARLTWELRRVAEELGATVFENSRVADISRTESGVLVETDAGVVVSERAVVATNAYRGPIRSPRRYVIPVYDHVLMTEPLSVDQMDSIGWHGREGLGDASNQFHYYRLTEDNRILWGGYDAAYHWRNGVDGEYDQSSHTHPMLADHFFQTFPQLEGVRFTHRWGGPIGTTTRFTAAWGTTHDDRVAWVAGYTGLGVGASRFGARVALDLVDGHDTERTELEMVRKNPFPFPPEPFRWTGVQLTRRAIQRSDRREGRRGPWLGLLDRFGIGFDS